MEIREILSRCDHTLLRPECTPGEIRELCDQAVRFGCASVCIPPAHVAGARRYVGNRMRICTVIGFPNGYATPVVKSYEAADAIAHGADEVDMVVNLGMVKDGSWGNVLDDIRAVRASSAGKVLKVIIETCLLTEHEKIQLCRVVTDSGADFIKTSTGFSDRGATLRDVMLLRRNCGARVKIKAAGGIATLDAAEQLIQAGADRLGASRLVKQAMELEKSALEHPAPDGAGEGAAGDR